MEEHRIILSNNVNQYNRLVTFSIKIKKQKDTKCFITYNKALWVFVGWKLRHGKFFN